jgi:hypothetical protein
MGGKPPEARRQAVETVNETRIEMEQSNRRILF